MNHHKSLQGLLELINDIYKEINQSHPKSATLDDLDYAAKLVENALERFALEMDDEEEK